MRKKQPIDHSTYRPWRETLSCSDWLKPRQSHAGCPGRHWRCASRWPSPRSSFLVPVSHNLRVLVLWFSPHLTSCCDKFYRSLLLHPFLPCLALPCLAFLYLHPHLSFPLSLSLPPSLSLTSALSCPFSYTLTQVNSPHACVQGVSSKKAVYFRSKMSVN